MKSYIGIGGFAKGPHKLEKDGFVFVSKVTKKEAGHLLDGKEYLEYPNEFKNIL